MKKRFTNWVKTHKVLRVLLPGIMALLLVAAMVVPSAFAALTYLDVEGTYTVTGRIPVKYMDRTYHPNMPRDGTLTITTQTDQVISAATLTMFGEDVALTGIVGDGTRPYISLTGDDGTDTYLTITGRVNTRASAVTAITGHITGFIISDGEKWTCGDGSAATSTVQAYSGTYSALLTAGTGADPTAVIFHNPENNFTLSDMATLAASERDGLSFYYYASQATDGPQLMLRFAPEGSTGSLNMSYWGGDGTSYVDITANPLKASTATGAWTKYTFTSASVTGAYFGNDPTDFTAFGGAYVSTLAEIEADINAESAMTAGGDTCGDWVLTFVAVELYEAGARTCYIDDVQIGRRVYTLEPNQFSARFRAKAD